MSQSYGVGGLICAVFGFAICVCCVFSKKLCQWKLSEHNREHTRTHSEVYLVTTHDEDETSVNTSIPEFLTNSETNPGELDLITRNRQRGENQVNENILSPLGLPSYDDVISGKIDGKIGLPPPYSEAANAHLITSYQPLDSGFHHARELNGCGVKSIGYRRMLNFRGVNNGTQSQKAIKERFDICKRCMLKACIESMKRTD